MALVVLGLLVTSVFIWNEWRLTGAITGVPLDDSWIHYRFADNLRRGDGFSFNHGQPTPGSTSPLWVILLGLLGSGYVVPSKAIGALAYVLTGPLVFRMGRQYGLTLASAFTGGVLVLVMGRLAWTGPSGMETAWFAMMCLAAVGTWAGARTGPRRLGSSVLFGLAALLRPEGILLLALSGIDWLVVQRRSLLRAKAWTPFLRHALVTGLMAAIYPVFAWLTTGNLLPNTFYAKSSTWNCEGGLGYFAWIATVFLLDNALAVVLALAGMFWVIRKRDMAHRGTLLAGLWMWSLPLLYGLIAPCTSIYFLRYTTPVLPLLALFSAFGLWRLETALLARSRRGPLWAGLVSVSAVLLGLLPILSFWAPHYGASVRDIQQMHVNIAVWLAANSSPDEVVAANDIGAIGFLSDRPVLDLVGLVSPEVLPVVKDSGPGQWDEGLYALLTRRRPEYISVFPDWYPALLPRLPATAVYRVKLSNRTISAGEEMVVYRLDWPADGAVP